ncbi:MAG: UDP-N-acetylmuramoyl-L-alanine--D-glutamate ligase [Thermodesulfovibrionales bacterium]
MKDLRDKHVTVVGLARSGTGAANLLSELGAIVTVTDLKTEDQLKDFIPGLNPSVRLMLGSHPEDIFAKAELLVISPGVPLDIPPVAMAAARGVPIIGELELAYQVIRSQKTEYRKQIEFLAVTGTNGKSTTTALLDFMIKKGGYKTILGGNIGNALTEEIYKQRAKSKEQNVDYIVAEVSSFQLESIKDFRPKGAAIVNITPDHLDRYHSLEEYRIAKARICENQGTADFLVLNHDDPETMKVKSEKLKVKIFFFSRKEEVNGIYLKNGVVYCNFQDSTPGIRHSALIKADEIKIKGIHNLENAMAASAMALLAGCPIEAVIDSLKEFPGLEHRLEFVRELDGVSYFNDSKGTNVGAVMKSLESFSGPIILIAGGRDKAGDFSLMRQLVSERVKALVLIGEAGEKIGKALGDLTETVQAKDLKEAVAVSRKLSVHGDVVLLSPACASFDMFRDFEDRGRQFKKSIMEMQ